MPEGNLNPLWARFLKKKKDLQAREELAKTYFFLVEAETRRMLARLPLRAYWEKREDLGSAGVIGFCKPWIILCHQRKKASIPAGLSRLMPATGFAAKWWMNCEIWILPGEICVNKPGRSRKRKENWKARFGRSPREEETAKALGIPLSELYDWIAEINMLNLLPLDAEIAGDGEGGSWADVLADAKAENPLDKVEKQEKIEQVAEALKNLGDAEQKVLHLYYVETLTFKEIGRILKVSESQGLPDSSYGGFSSARVVGRKEEAWRCSRT